MAITDWKVQWKKGTTVRYWGSKASHEIQIGRYRDADDFDKAMKNKYAWHGKWYVDFMSSGRETKLFNTRTEALSFAKSYMRSH